jgi:small-conductance mechanosensitive channel
MITNYTFNGQKPGEKVVDVVNNHPYVLYPSGFRTIILIVCVVAVFLFWPAAYLFAIIIGLLALLYFFNAFYSYRESILIITNQRVFSVEQRGFFKRKIIEVDLDKIQDIQVILRGSQKCF